ncbi:hypothetical protein D3C75_703350 [compost metagenome]
MFHKHLTKPDLGALLEIRQMYVDDPVDGVRENILPFFNCEPGMFASNIVFDLPNDRIVDNRPFFRKFLLLQHVPATRHSS